MSCGTYHQFSQDESNGAYFCINCGVREYFEPESDPDADRDAYLEIMEMLRA